MYAAITDGGMSTIVHLLFRVPALGLVAFAVGSGFLFYPATINPQPTQENPRQVAVSCPAGGTHTKVQEVSPSGETSVTFYCAAGAADTAAVEAYVDEVIPQ